MGAGHRPPLVSDRLVRSQLMGTTMVCPGVKSCAIVPMVFMSAGVMPVNQGAYLRGMVAPEEATSPTFFTRARNRFTIPFAAFTCVFVASTTKMSGVCYVGPTPVTNPQGVMKRSGPRNSAGLLVNKSISGRPLGEQGFAAPGGGVQRLRRSPQVACVLVPEVAKL